MKNKPGLKGYLLLLGILVFFQFCGRDSRGNEDIFAELEGEEGIYTFKVPASLFMMVVRSEAPSGEKVDDLGHIEIVKLLIFDAAKSKSKTAGNITDEIYGKFSDFGYELVISVSSGGTNFAAYILDRGDFVSDMMAIISDKESVTGIGLSGRLDAGSIADFASEMDYARLKEIVDKR